MKIALIKEDGTWEEKMIRLKWIKYEGYGTNLFNVCMHLAKTKLRTPLLSSMTYKIKGLTNDKR